jgi:hypothetical protein
MIKSLIAQNNGRVDVELLPSGKIEGSGVSVNMRWLVIGDDTKLISGETGNDANVKKRAELEQQAKALGVSRISVEKLMGWLKGAGDEDVVPLGSATRASDFIRREAPTSSTGRVSEVYQNREGRAVPPDQAPGSER